MQNLKKYINESLCFEFTYNIENPISKSREFSSTLKSSSDTQYSLMDFNGF